MRNLRGDHEQFEILSGKIPEGVELRSLEDLEYLRELAFNYDRNTMSREELKAYLDEHLFLGYEVWKDEKRIGVTFSMLFENVDKDGKRTKIYTIDGYNDGASARVSISIGIYMLGEMFEYTPIVYVCFEKTEKSVMKLAKRLGFKPVIEDERVIVMKACRDD